MLILKSQLPVPWSGLESAAASAGDLSGVVPVLFGPEGQHLELFSSWPLDTGPLPPGQHRQGQHAVPVPQQCVIILAIPSIILKNRINRGKCQRSVAATGFVQQASPHFQAVTQQHATGGPDREKKGTVGKNWRKKRSFCLARRAN